MHAFLAVAKLFVAFFDDPGISWSLY